MHGSHQRFDDLHVDEIDARYKDRDQWMNGVAHALEQAVAIRDEKDLPFTIAVGIALAPSAEALGAVPADTSELSDAMDLTPPSLYAFPVGQTPWIKESGCRPIEISMENDRERSRWYMREQFDEGGQEFNRTLWLVK